ncbi:serine hydrolase domain-containing protein [Paucibacter sp. APW11]|uniref:Serine hydrolase domain-containing protein n=1 Tax=Roseateles aquae TaxID=3077235 RepID=A0ABU3PHG2_9BURK|nr:serine hydrolase domain-containing protein [Paucibacter sp. APW11]MDT9001471.1 serine hydrolase domain-containing protein [Paucibacter sp. APW11]
MRLAAICLAFASSAQAESIGLSHQQLQRLAEQNKVCLIVVARLQHGQLSAVDSASACEQPSASPEAVFQAASLGKPVFAYGVLKLAERLGKSGFDLDAPLSRYLPQGYLHQHNHARPEPGRADLLPAAALEKITARMILQHGTGLPNWSSEALVPEQPAGRWNYSGEGYLLLQAAIEAISGQPLDVWARQAVFEPLGMTHSDFRWNAERTQPGLVDGHGASGKPLGIKPIQHPRAAFSLYTSAPDYARFLAAVLADKALLKTVLAAPLPVDPQLGLSWGLGWGIAERRAEAGAAPDQLIWHWGSNWGYRAFVAASAQTGDGLVMLSNSENGLALAEPLTLPVLPGSQPLFRFYMLRSGAAHWLCKNLGWCG